VQKQNNRQWKKLIAPIVVTIFMIVILAIYGFAWTSIAKPLGLKIGVIVIALALIGVNVANLCERIKEIRSGESDDLSKY